ncbi:MAG: NUDIX hydrolase, partial [Gammaproteobacteria bacterium]
MPRNIDVTVAAVIERDSRYLVVEELVGGRHVFNQPAGHLEVGETLEEAVIREVREETGYEFTPLTFLGVFSWHGESRSFLRVSFSGDVDLSEEQFSLDDGIIATHWLTRAELLQRESMLRSPMVLSCIDRYREGIHYPLSTICELVHHMESVA